MRWIPLLLLMVGCSAPATPEPFTGQPITIQKGDNGSPTDEEDELQPETPAPAGKNEKSGTSTTEPKNTLCDCIGPGVPRKECPMEPPSGC